MDVLKRIPVREQDAKERATNFKEVCLGYNKEEAMEEASRCINCKNAQCVKGCPVAIQIPQFIEQVKNGNIEEAYRIIANPAHFPLSAVVYARRRASVKENVSAVSRGIPSPSVNWSVSLQTGQEKTVSNPHRQHRRTAKR